MKKSVEAPKIRVPAPDTQWGEELIRFALSYNGYQRHEGTPSPADIANPLLRSWSQGKELDAELPHLRCALFFEQRRAHHTDQAPDPDYLVALLTAIHKRSGGWVDGPADEHL